MSGWVWHVVEREPGQRAFAWLGLSRRLPKDYEVLPEVSEAMVLLASIRLTVRRLA